jgi:flagellar protein FlaG
MVNDIGNAKSLVVPPIQTTASAESGVVVNGAKKAEPVEPPVATTAPSYEEVISAMNKMQDMVQMVSRDLNFSLDEESGEVVIKVIDSATEELVRQIPSEEALRVARALENGESFLVETKA